LSEKRKLAIAFALAIVAIGIVGVLKWHYVADAQKRLTAEMASTMESLTTWPFSATGSLSATSIPLPTFDLVGMPKRQAELAITRSAMGMLSTLAIFGGCFAVAYLSRRAWPPTAVAVFGWLLNGLIAAVFTQQALALVNDLPRTLNGPGITWREPNPGGPPFGLYVLLGLFSALIWQGVVPGFAGWFAGTRFRSWVAWGRSFSVGPGGPVAPEMIAPVPVVRSSKTCPCGAVNLSAATVCYACGATLENVGLAGLDAT
jgi:hypothetical protein